MTKAQVIKFFELNKNEYLLFEKYYNEITNGCWINYAKIGRELNQTRQNIGITFGNLRLKIKLGNKFLFYDEYKDVDFNSMKELNEVYEDFLVKIYERCNYELTKITVLNINKRIYNVLRNKHKIDTLNQFVVLINEKATNNNCLKLDGLGSSSSKLLLRNFRLLIRAKYGR